ASHEGMNPNSISLWKLRPGALGFGVLALVVVYGITQVYSNDVRLMYGSGAVFFFLAAIWLGRRKEDWLAATLLVGPLLITFCCVVLVEVSSLWPHLLLWLATAALGLVFLRIRHQRRGLTIALTAALVVASIVYCEWYIPLKLTRKFNRFANSSAPI